MTESKNLPPSNSPHTPPSPDVPTGWMGVPDQPRPLPPFPRDDGFSPTFFSTSVNLPPLDGGTDNIWSHGSRDTPLVLREAAKATRDSNKFEDYAASIEIIRRRLQERPDDVRAAARNLANAFEQQAKELREGNIPNESGPLAQYKNLLDFFEEMAAGLAELADALDRAFSSATGSPASSPEPIFLGKAAETARWLQGRTHQWLEEIGTDVIGVPVRIGVLLTGIEFLHLLGADSAAAIGALWLTCQGKKRKSP